MKSLDGASLFIILAFIVLLMMGLSSPMPKAEKTRIAGKFRHKCSRKDVLDIPMEEDPIINLIETQRVYQNSGNTDYGEYAGANIVKNTEMFF